MYIYLHTHTHTRTHTPTRPPRAHPHTAKTTRRDQQKLRPTPSTSRHLSAPTRPPAADEGGRTHAQSAKNRTPPRTTGQTAPHPSPPHKAMQRPEQSNPGETAEAVARVGCAAIHQVRQQMQVTSLLNQSGTNPNLFSYYGTPLNRAVREATQNIQVAPPPAEWSWPNQ